MLLRRLCRQARLTIWDLDSEKVESTSDIPSPGFCRFSLLPASAGEGIVRIRVCFLLDIHLYCIAVLSKLVVAGKDYGKVCF